MERELTHRIVIQATYGSSMSLIPADEDRFEIIGSRKVYSNYARDTAAVGSWCFQSYSEDVSFHHRDKPRALARKDYGVTCRKLKHKKAKVW